MTTQTLTRPHFGTFTIERAYKHSPERVFGAFENADAFYRWFISGEGWEIGSLTHDFRVGGHGRSEFRPEGHPEWFGNDTWYLEIARNHRIVTAYTNVGRGQADVAFAVDHRTVQRWERRLPLRIHGARGVLWRRRTTSGTAAPAVTNCSTSSRSSCAAIPDLHARTIWHCDSTTTPCRPTAGRR
jgi:uncharacterized protein YndB with AHSA1/START domain